MTDQAFCPHCGARRPEWAKFCGTCGNAHDMPPTVETPAAAVPVGFTLAFPIAGSYRVTVTDAGSAALATGVVTAQ